jgi:putative transposase
MWKGHNFESIFTSPVDKTTYLDLMTIELPKADYQLHGYSMMSNHNHEVGRVLELQSYSSMLRNVHSSFAQKYNRKNNRRGAVGMDRPKTVVVQNDRHLMNVAFYIDANPVRAGIVKHPKDYCWSSYSYYANGTTSPWSKTLTPYDWYLDLGSTPAKRQRAYRRMCDAYLRRHGLVPMPGICSGYYIGSPSWKEARLQRQRETQHRARPVTEPLRGRMPDPIDTS